MVPFLLIAWLMSEAREKQRLRIKTVNKQKYLLIKTFCFFPTATSSALDVISRAFKNLFIYNSSAVGKLWGKLVFHYSLYSGKILANIYIMSWNYSFLGNVLQQTERLHPTIFLDLAIIGHGLDWERPFFDVFIKKRHLNIAF